MVERRTGQQKSDAKAERDKRLKAALKSNIARRKAQAKLRADSKPEDTKQN